MALQISNSCSDMIFVPHQLSAALFRQRSGVGCRSLGLPLVDSH